VLLDQAGSSTSYASLRPADGVVTKTIAFHEAATDGFRLPTRIEMPPPAGTPIIQRATAPIRRLGRRCQARDSRHTP
jgi:hypothetical protein